MLNDNDSMRSSLENYDITENRMINSTSNVGGNKNGSGEKGFKIFGKSISTGRVAAGTVFLILCEVIAVTSKVDGKFSDASMVALLIGFIGAALIWFLKIGK